MKTSSVFSLGTFFRRAPWSLGGAFFCVVILLSGCAAPKTTPILFPTPTLTPTVVATIPGLPWRSFPKDIRLEAGEDPVTVLCVGDIMFGRYVEEARVARGGVNPFQEVRDALSSGDLAVGNLECVLGEAQTSRAWAPRKKILLLGSTEAAQAMWDAGFRLLSVGNNHALDFREEGFASTTKALKAVGLAWVGVWEDDDRAVEPWIFETRGVKVAFLAYSDVSPGEFRYGGVGHPGTIPPLPKALQRDISNAKRLADFVVVQAHWGVEYQTQPTPRQKALAHRMIDLGADAVVGHHPHLLQPTERYKGKFIIYSLGNFLFDLKRPTTHPGLILRLRLEKGRPAVADFLPTWSGDMFPRPPRAEEETAYPPWLRMTPPTQP